MICNWIKKLFKKKEKTVIPVFKPTSTHIWRDSELKLFDAVNKYRFENNLTALVKDDNHYVIAINRNANSIDANELTHHWFFSEVRDKLSAIGVNNSSENIGYGYKTINGIFGAWIRSDGHNENMLGDWKYTGISITKDADNRAYYCQIFGK